MPGRVKQTNKQNNKKQDRKMTTGWGIKPRRTKTRDYSSQAQL